MGVFLYCKKCKLIYLEDAGRHFCEKCGKKLYSSSTEYLDAYEDKGFAIVRSGKTFERDEDNKDDTEGSFNRMISEREAEKKRLREEQRSRRDEKKKELLKKRNNMRKVVSATEATSASSDVLDSRPDTDFNVGAFLKGLNLE